MMLPVSCSSPSTRKDESNFDKPNTSSMNSINVRLMSAEIWRSYYAQNKNLKPTGKLNGNMSDAVKHKRKRSINEEQQGPVLQKRSFSSAGINSSNLSRPSSSNNLGRISIASNVTSAVNETHRNSEECGYVKLPTIPPLTVLVTPDGNVAPNTIATLPLAVPGPVRTPTMQSNNRLDSYASRLASPSSTSALVTPIAVNYTPSKDAKLVCASKAFSPTARLNVPSTDSVSQHNSEANGATDSVVSSNLISSTGRATNHLNVPVSQLNYPSSVSATANSDPQLTPKVSPVLPNTILGSTFDASAVNAYGNSLVSDIRSLSNSTLLQNNSAATYLLQQQQQAQMLSNANICGLLATSELTQSRNILSNVSANSNLLANPSTTNTFVSPISSVLNSDILRQYQQQQQIHFNSLPSPPDLLSFYRLLVESSDFQGYQSQMKKIDNPTAYVGQNAAGITT
uniref:Fork-head domain-containing protein n=1 Tax=Syphacia muris TaxID=451379 RepID=A0A0N5ADN6_9BILA